VKAGAWLAQTRAPDGTDLNGMRRDRDDVISYLIENIPAELTLTMAMTGVIM